MTTDHGVPVIYGAPARLAVLLASITRVVEHEPDEVFADADVRQSGQQLTGLIERRVARATGDAAAAQPDSPATERPSR